MDALAAASFISRGSVQAQFAHTAFGAVYGVCSAGLL